MKLFKKIPKVLILISAALVVAYIIVTLVGHISTASRVNARKEEIQQRQEAFYVSNES